VYAIVATTAVSPLAATPGRTIAVPATGATTLPDASSGLNTTGPVIVAEHKNFPAVSGSAPKAPGGREVRYAVAFCAASAPAEFFEHSAKESS